MLGKVSRILSTVLIAACSASGPTATPNPPSPTPATQLPSASPGASTEPQPGTVEGARADLETLVTTMERSDASEWRAAVARLDELIPSLVPDDPAQLMVEFMRLVALPGVVGGRHGHVQAWPSTDRPALGLVTYTFADGIYVTRALPDQQDLIGGRVTAVAGRPIDEVEALLDPLITRDNDWTTGVWFIDYLRRPEVLLGLGLVDAVGPVEFTLAMPDGSLRVGEIPVLGPGDELQPTAPALSWLSDVDPWFLTLHYLPERTDSLWTSRMGEPLWWQVIDDGATLYVQQNLVEPPSAEQLAAILASATDATVERVILDLRHNMGGDDATSTILTFRNPRIAEPGRLFVITSNHVFSAATFIADELDQFTEAVFVGEPTGGAPGFIMGGFTITLDRLPIPLVVDIPVSTAASAGTSPSAVTVAPDLPVPLSGADYFGGRDAAMEAIGEYVSR